MPEWVLPQLCSSLRIERAGDAHEPIDQHTCHDSHILDGQEMHVIVLEKHSRFRRKQRVPRIYRT